MHTTWVELDAAALRDNLRTFQQRVAPAAVMAVVKGNAYGHGLAEVADVLRGEAAWFGVNALHEAEALRRDGHEARVLILGTMHPAQAGAIVRGGFSQAVYDHASLDALDQAATRAGTRARVHLKVETGTNRQGLAGSALCHLAAEARARAGIELEGAYTHYANVEEAEEFGYAAQQLRRFEQALARVETNSPVSVKHTACTAAAILYPQTYFNLVRVGIGLYGLWPSAETKRAACAADRTLALRPALSWKCRIAQIKDVPAGEPVGYGCTFRSERPSRIAVLPAGYYEGLDRGLSNTGAVLIGGRRAPIAGRVCMNMTMVDVTKIPTATAGDEAVLIGRQGDAEISADEMAAWAGTINYEVVTRIAAMLPRVVV